MGLDPITHLPIRPDPLAIISHLVALANLTQAASDHYYLWEYKAVQKPAPPAIISPEAMHLAGTQYSDTSTIGNDVSFGYPSTLSLDKATTASSLIR